MTKLKNVIVRRGDVGWHGVASATVLEIKGSTATIDLSSWVDEDGFGPSDSGEWIKKEFPAVVVLLEDISMTEEFTRNADIAYIGTNGRHYDDRYHADFETLPPEGEYEAFFPHKVLRQEGAEPFITEVEKEDYTLEEVAELLTTVVPNDINGTDVGDETPNENES